MKRMGEEKLGSVRERGENERGKRRKLRENKRKRGTILVHFSRLLLFIKA